MLKFNHILLKLCLIVTVFSLAIAVMGQDGGTLTYDQAVSGVISDATPEIRYNFDGAAGDVLIIRMTATEPSLDGYLQLLDAAGQVLYFDDDSAGNLNPLLGPFILPVNGTYTVVASRCCDGTGASVGAFDLVVSRAQVTPLTPNETVSVDLNDATPNVYFNFSGTPGQIVSITGQLLEGSSGYNIIVRDPLGGFASQVYGNVGYPALVDPLIISQSGTYLVSITREQLFGPDGQPAATPGVRVGVTLGIQQSQEIVFDSPVSGVLDDNNVSDYFVFSAQAGELIRIVGSREQNSQAFEAQIISYQGAFVANSYSGDPDMLLLDPIQLPDAGQYLLVVRRLDQFGTGLTGTVSRYTVTVGPSQAPVLQAGVEVIDSIVPPAYEKVYRFDATEGQVIRVTLRSVTQTYAPGLNVTGPNMPQPTAYDIENAPAIGGGGGGYVNYIMNVNSALPSTVTYEVTLKVTGTYLFRVNNAFYSIDGAPPSGDFGLKVEVLQ